MNTKLTLRMDKDLIQRAKAYGRRKGKSVSQMVADYFSVLEAPPKGEKPEFTPLVQSLKGILKGAEIQEQDYRRYLEEKYL